MKALRHFSSLWIGGFLTLMPASHYADEAPKEVDRQMFSLHLTDGSCVLGAPLDVSAFIVETPIGKLKLPIERLQHIIREDDQWIFLMRNGDRAEGLWARESVEVETLFGKVNMPIKHVEEIQIDPVGEPKGFSRRELVLYYSFDNDKEEIRDTARFENHGKNRNATFSDKGIKGKALQLDGVKSHIEMGDGPIASLPTWDEYTISVWFLNDGKGDPDWGYGQKIIDKTVMYHDFYLCVRATGTLSFMTYEGSGTSLNHHHDYRDGKWHHAVVVKKGSRGELWVDGILREACDGLKEVKSSGPLLLGYSKSPDSNQTKYWSGQLDELLIYKRALSKGEIARLYKMVK